MTESIKPLVAKRLNMNGSKPLAVSINTRTAKKVNGVPFFGTIIDICKDKRGVTMYDIEYDDPDVGTESITFSII